MTQLLGAPQIGFPPFPIVYLQGTPIFWDDFESGPAGFVSEDRNDGVSNQILDAGNRWTFSDGNEYSAYITSEMSSTGTRSMRLGGSQTVWNTNSSEAGTQDLSTLVPIQTGIIGVEFSINFNSFASTGGPNLLLSIEDRDPNVNASPNFREMWLQIGPRVPAVYFWPTNQQVTLISDGATVAPGTGITYDNAGAGGVGRILATGIGTSGAYVGRTVTNASVGETHLIQLQTNSIITLQVPWSVIPGAGTAYTINPSTDDTGQVIQQQLTGGFSGGKGSAQSWHRVAFIVDQKNGKFLQFYMDKYHVDLQAKLTAVGLGLTNMWRTTAATSFSTQEGLIRVEIHSRKGSGATDTILYIDNLVVTDEGKPR